MTKGSSSILRGLICAITCMIVTLTTARAAEDAPLIPNDAEYAVFAAVLFPCEPEVPDTVNSSLEKRACLDLHRVRLDGIHSNYYRVSRLTITGSQANKGSDEAMIADYNRKNAQVCRIDEEKLRALAPKEGKIALVSPPRFNMGADGEKTLFGVTYLSRPGFNQDRTKAVLQINHVADYEMGVGYLVYLKKSSKNTWVMTGAVLNRKY